MEHIIKVGYDEFRKAYEGVKKYHIVPPKENINIGDSIVFEMDENVLATKATVLGEVESISWTRRLEDLFRKITLKEAGIDKWEDLSQEFSNVQKIMTIGFRMVERTGKLYKVIDKSEIVLYSIPEDEAEKCIQEVCKMWRSDFDRTMSYIERCPEIEKDIFYYYCGTVISMEKNEGIIQTAEKFGTQTRAIFVLLDRVFKRKPLKRVKKMKDYLD